MRQASAPADELIVQILSRSGEVWTHDRSQEIKHYLAYLPMTPTADLYHNQHGGNHNHLSLSQSLMVSFGVFYYKQFECIIRRSMVSEHIIQTGQFTSAGKCGIHHEESVVVRVMLFYDAHRA